jgi:serine/threonine protein kinase
MDYALDHSRKFSSYLGDDALIKDISLQLLDAADYCHTLGIYRRDLKPENVLCFDDGLRVAITDFGLVTTEKVSRECHTGNVYHMSPECQGREFAPTGISLSCLTIPLPLVSFCSTWPRAATLGSQRQLTIQLSRPPSVISSTSFVVFYPSPPRSTTFCHCSCAKIRSAVLLVRIAKRLRTEIGNPKMNAPVCLP